MKEGYRDDIADMAIANVMRDSKRHRLKSCQYCGRIHDKKFNCGKKPVRKKYFRSTDKFRSSNEWKYKREYIKERDNYLCQVCIRNLYGTIR